VSVFKVDRSTGALTPVAQSRVSQSRSSNAYPNSVAFSPGGGLLATAN
jgi:hypothetical protein